VPDKHKLYESHNRRNKNTVVVTLQISKKRIPKHPAHPNHKWLVVRNKWRKYRNRKQKRNKYKTQNVKQALAELIKYHLAV
jgi:kynurenine formamidase